MLDRWYVSLPSDLVTEHSLSTWYYEALFTLHFTPKSLFHTLGTPFTNVNLQFGGTELLYLARHYLRNKSLTNNSFETRYEMFIRDLIYYL